MTYLHKLMLYAEEERLPLYFEHNDFMNGNINVNQEAADLIASSETDPDTAIQMMNLNRVWSARIYHDRDNYTIAYHYNLEDAAQMLFEALEQRGDIAA